MEDLRDGAAEHEKMGKAERERKEGKRGKIELRKKERWCARIVEKGERLSRKGKREKYSAMDEERKEEGCEGKGIGAKGKVTRGMGKKAEREGDAEQTERKGGRGIKLLSMEKREN